MYLAPQEPIMYQKLVSWQFFSFSETYCRGKYCFSMRNVDRRIDRRTDSQRNRLSDIGSDRKTERQGRQKGRQTNNQ
jgi:hypothetical protein